MVGLPVKLHGAREQSIGVKYIWGLNGEMYKDYKMWFPRKKLDKALADPRVVMFDVRWMTTPDLPRALQDMRGAARLLPIIFDNNGEPLPIPEGYCGVLGVMTVHMGSLELRRLGPGAFDLAPLLPASIRQSFPSYDSIIAPNAFDVPAGIFDAGPLRGGPMLSTGEMISIGGTFKDGTIDGIDFVDPDCSFGPPARHSGVVYDVVGDSALIYDALTKDALAALLRRPRLSVNTVLSAEGSLVLTYRTRTVALTNILGRLEIVTPRLVALRKGCTSDRLAESQVRCPVPLPLSRACSSRACPAAVPADRVLVALQVMLGEDTHLRLINPPPDDVIHQTVARKTRRGTLENVQGSICEKLAREVSELRVLPAYATFIVERVMPHEFFSLPGVREKMVWLERSTSMDTELTMEVVVESVNKWRDILGPTFNYHLVWKALAPRVTAVLGKRRQRPERLPTYYQLTGGEYDLKPNKARQDAVRDGAPRAAHHGQRGAVRRGVGPLRRRRAAAGRPALAIPCRRRCGRVHVVWIRTRVRSEERAGTMFALYGPHVLYVARSHTVYCGFLAPRPV